MTSIKDFKEAISYSCCIIIIFQVAMKDIILDINKFDQISFVGVGDIALNDINKFKSLGFQGRVVGSKGYDGDKFDPEIFKILNSRMKNKLIYNSTLCMIQKNMISNYKSYH